MKDARWLRERIHEAYAKNYSIVFPHDEPLAARPMKKDPLFEDLLNQGCVFEERHGFERPGWFARDGRNEVSLQLRLDPPPERNARRTVRGVLS